MIYKYEEVPQQAYLVIVATSAGTTALHISPKQGSSVLMHQDGETAVPFELPPLDARGEPFYELVRIYRIPLRDTVSKGTTEHMRDTHIQWYDGDSKGPPPIPMQKTRPTQPASKPQLFVQPSYIIARDWKAPPTSIAQYIVWEHRDGRSPGVGVRAAHECIYQQASGVLVNTLHPVQPGAAHTVVEVAANYPTGRKW